MTNQQKADRIISVYCDGDVNEAWRENMRTVIKSALDAVVKEKDDENLQLRELLKEAQKCMHPTHNLKVHEAIDAAINPKGEPQP